MKKAACLLIAFLLSGIVSFASFESVSQIRATSVNCPKSFRRNRHQPRHADSRQPTLFDNLPEETSVPLPPDRSRQTSSDYSRGAASRNSNKRSSETKRRTRLTKEQKEKAETDFLAAFKSENFSDIRALVTEFPFLKKIRFTDPAVLEGIAERDRHWCSRGWSPLGLAAYKKQLELFDFLLSLGMDVRTIKKPGGESVESNPLHISLRRGFREGAVNVLEHVGYVRFGTEKNRFIDEKDHQKLTPWALAIERDSIRRTISYIKIIGQYNPSGYVSSYTLRGPKDGYEIAEATHSRNVVEHAEMYLVAPKYFQYKDIRENSLRPDLKPPF